MTIDSNPTNVRWYYTDAQNQAVGPFSFEDLKKLHSNGLITSDTNVVEEGGAEWKQLRAVLPASLPLPPPLPAKQKLPRRWPAVLFTLFLFPLGLIALWISKGYNRQQKLLLSGTSVLLFFGGMLMGRPGFIFLALLANCLFFIWWARQIRTPLKVALSVVLALLFLPPAFTSASSNDAGPAFSDPEQPVAASQKEEAPIELGKEFRLGDFTYQIVNYTGKEQIGDRYTGATASNGAIFLIVYYTIKNESNKTRTVLSDDFTLLDAQGREFRPASSAVTSLALSDKKDYLFSELQPGITKETVTAFEVPYEVVQGRLTLVVPEKGWGQGKKQVLLNPGSKG